MQSSLVSVSLFSLLQVNRRPPVSKQLYTKANSSYQLFYFSFFHFFFLDSMPMFRILEDACVFCCLFLKLSRNNIFLTLVTNTGNVLVSLSSGKVGLSSSKRKTTFAIRLLVNALLSFLTQKQILHLKFFFVQTTWLKLAKLVISLSREAGVVIQYLLFAICYEHGLGLRKRKPRRL